MRNSSEYPDIRICRIPGTAPEVSYLRSPFLDPSRNLRLEEELFRSSRQGILFMLWRNSSSVIIGSGQIAEEEVCLEYARAQNIPVLRRSTGGGAVYHDEGNINFSIIEECPSGTGWSLRQLSRPLVYALAQMGADVHFGGRNDLLLPDGRKVCGTAARIAGGRLLFHGCICFDTDLGRMEKLLTPSEEKLERHGIASVRSRVGCLREYLPHLTAGSFLDALERQMISFYMETADLYGEGE